MVSALRCFDNTIALLAVYYSSAIKSEHRLAEKAYRLIGKANKIPEAVSDQQQQVVHPKCALGHRPMPF